MHIPSTLNPHPTFDRVPEENYPNPWPRWREKKFQKELDRLAGVASNGRSNLRLLWPADADESLSMELIAGEKKARYRLYTTSYRCTSVSEAGLEVIQDIDVDICMNRYVIEQYHLPEEERLGSFKEASKGNGFYSHLFTVAHHDEKCCGGTEGIKGRLCLGLYREPGTADIYNAQRMIRERNAKFYSDRLAELPPDEEVRQEARENRDLDERTTRLRQLAYSEAAMSGFMPHMHRMFTDNPKTLKHGRYHFTPPSVKETTE
jgi:hypothetical protein